MEERAQRNLRALAAGLLEDRLIVRRHAVLEARVRGGLAGEHGVAPRLVKQHPASAR